MPSDARASFSTSEIIRVLEVFGIGGLKSLADLPAGSRKAAKLVATCVNGSYLLKRRELQGAGLDRIRYASEVHRHAMKQGVPCAPLMTTADDEPFFVEGPYIYEVQGFVAGHRFAHRHDQATAVGDHEVNRLGRHELCRHHEVAFVFTVFFIDQNHHTPHPELVNDL